MTNVPLAARVVAILDEDGRPLSETTAAAAYEGDILEVLISAGTINGVKEDMRFVLYEEGDELFDPVTSGSLGRFELVKGRAKAVHVQEKMSRVRSTQTRRVASLPSLYKGSGEPEYRTVAVPFKGVKIGDIVRPI